MRWVDDERSLASQPDRHVNQSWDSSQVENEVEEGGVMDCSCVMR